MESGGAEDIERVVEERSECDMKTPEERADDYAEEIVQANPYQGPEWSRLDVVEAWYQGYIAGKRDATALQGEASPEFKS